MKKNKKKNCETVKAIRNQKEITQQKFQSKTQEMKKIYIKN